MGAYDRLEAQTVALLETALALKGRLTRDQRAVAARLADRLHVAGVDLCMDKATEFSPDIPRRFVLAAKVALLAYGADAPEIERFERDVPTTARKAEWRLHARDYEDFKRALTGAAPT